MRVVTRWIGTFGLLLALSRSARGQEPKADAPEHPDTAPTSEPSDDIDPALVSSMKAEIPDDFVTHKDAGGNFTIKTPPSWTEKPRRRGPVLMLLQSDTPGATVNVVVLPSPPGERLKAAMASMPEQLAKQFNGFKLIKSDYVLFCGRPSGRLVYDVAPTNGKPIQIMQIFLVRGGKDYVLTFTAPADTYNDAYKAAQPVIASFDLADAEPTSQP